MNLECRVGICPRGAGSEQLGHPCLNVAAFSEIFGPGGRIGQLARHDIIGKAHRDLVRDPGEVNDRFSKLGAVQRIIETEFERALGDAYATGCGLDARTFKRTHQLLEPLPLFTTQKSIRGRRHAVKLQCVFTHSPVTQNLNLAARHPGRRKKIVRRPARLGYEQHRKPLIAFDVRTGTNQHRHHVRTAGMGDPGLGTVNPPPFIRDKPGAGLERAEIGSGIGFGKHRRRQDFSARDLWKPLRLLFPGAAKRN